MPPVPSAVVLPATMVLVRRVVVAPPLPTLAMPLPCPLGALLPAMVQLSKEVSRLMLFRPPPRKVAVLLAMVLLRMVTEEPE